MSSENEVSDIVEVEKDTDEPIPPSDGFRRYLRAMRAPSTDISKLLNSHLLTEYYLEQIILNYLPRGDILLDEGKLNFSTKLMIVRSFDIVPDPLLASISHLNKVRNSASHEMDFKVTEADIDFIGRPFGKEHTRIKREYPTKALRYTLMRIIARLETISDSLTEQPNDDEQD